jgi:hypothetical protein
MDKDIQEISQAVGGTTEREGKYLAFTLAQEEYGIDNILEAAEVSQLAQAA